MRSPPVWVRLPLITVLFSGGLALAVVALAVSTWLVTRNGAIVVANPVASIDTVQPQRSTIYAADGSVLAVLHAAKNRSPVSINQVPADVIDAVVDTEDARFWSHGGVDLKSTVRALASNLGSGTALQGGSTITQQLVKNIFLTPQRDLSRKIKEAVIASRLQSKYTKSQILEAYLNTVYFGNGAYGIQAAANTYFNEDVSQLTPVQAAFVAGVIANPVGYDPILNTRNSLERRNYVLSRMANNGHLSVGDAEALKATPIPTIIYPSPAPDSNDGYYVEQIKQILLNNSITLGTTYSERYNALFAGGLKIYTNLDMRSQQLAQTAVAKDIPANPQGFTGALASIEPSTGKVRAIVGGPGFDTRPFDLATQASRQPGSGFKLFTLLAAYEAGYGPNDMVDGNSPCAVDFPSDHDLLTQPIHNDEGQAYGPISITQALADSVNCAFVRIAAEVGLPKVIAMAHRLGLLEPFQPFPALVIGGTDGVTVLEMADAYATLADDGVYHPPSFIDRITDNTGKTIYQNSYQGTRVLSPQISRTAVQTLEAVVQYGTGTAAALPNRPVAGKTGTTERNTNAWFNGFTPQLATSVWMGDPKANTPMYDVAGITVFGGTYPARVWHDYTASALQGQPAIDFPALDPTQMPPPSFINPPTAPTLLTPNDQQQPTTPVRRRPSVTAPPTGTRRSPRPPQPTTVAPSTTSTSSPP